MILQLNSISPTSGSAAGGTAVTLNGSGLSSVTSVLFGYPLQGTAKGSIQPGGSDTAITVLTPAVNAAGTVPVFVESPNGEAPPADSSIYFSFDASVTDVTATGNVVTISGAGLLAFTEVLFGNVPGTITNMANNGTQITVTAPQTLVPGPVDITLAGPNVIQPFTFNVAAPAPSSGPTPAPSGGQSGGNPQPENPQPSGTQPSNPQPSNPPSGTQPSNPQPGSPQPTPPEPSPQPATPQPSPQPTPQPAPGSPSPSAPTSGGPTPGDYIPGGAMIVPGGQTGLGGSAGTGAGFGVGTLMPGGGGSAAPSNLPYYVDPALTAQLVQSFISMVQNATSPDAQESQNIILRRMALEGDVIGSRIPPPQNISQIGGYLNLLGTLKESSMREQALAGILGVAGPTQPLGWITNTLPLAMVAIPNDRPAVAAQAAFPLTVLVRSDFVASVQRALNVLHSYGAMLPLVSPPVIQLPPGGTGATIPGPVLFYLGRTLMIAPSAALIDPSSDPVALIAPTGSLTDYGLVSKVINSGTYGVPPVDVQAVECTPTSEALISLNRISVVPIAPILNAAGFYSFSPFPVPANSSAIAWAWLTNTTGLVAGQTLLGDELSLLYRQDQIVNSAFAAMVNWTWNGTAFAPQ